MRRFFALLVCLFLITCLSFTASAQLMVGPGGGATLHRFEDSDVDFGGFAQLRVMYRYDFVSFSLDGGAYQKNYRDIQGTPSGQGFQGGSSLSRFRNDFMFFSPKINAHIDNLMIGFGYRMNSRFRQYIDGTRIEGPEQLRQAASFASLGFHIETEYISPEIEFQYEFVGNQRLFLISINFLINTGVGDYSYYFY